MTAKPRVLIIDDGEEYARIITEQMPEFEVVKPHSGEGPQRIQDGPAALAYLSRNARKVDLILLDMHFDVPDDRLLSLGEGISTRRLRRFQGVAILRGIHNRYPDMPVVLLTSVEDLSLVDASGELAAQSLTYFHDSEDLDALRIRINAALSEKALGLEEAGILWGKSSAMRSMRRRLSVLARGRMPVILEGETGTGKSFLAEKFIHANSQRPGPFVIADLSAVPETLISAHLFGATKGSYTGATSDRKGLFQLADGGTLFLDEVQNVPMDVQKQLLVALQEGRVRPLGSAQEFEVDVKVVAASNSPLDISVAEGRFRHDLYMRLSPATRIVVPPLRKRKEDLPFLARRFLSKAAEGSDIAQLLAEVSGALSLPDNTGIVMTVGREKAVDEQSDSLVLSFPGPAWKQLRNHNWPGNIRELGMFMRNILSFTLIGAVDAKRAGYSITSPRFQVDTGLVGELLSASKTIVANMPEGKASEDGLTTFMVEVSPREKLSDVAKEVEKQIFATMFRKTGGDFEKMAQALLGDSQRHRAIRLRLNQLGLKARELSRK